MDHFVIFGTVLCQNFFVQKPSKISFFNVNSQHKFLIHFHCTTDQIYRSKKMQKFLLFITFFLSKNPQKSHFLMWNPNFFFVEKISKFVIFWQFFHFWGGILEFWNWKKSQKIWQNSRKSPINFFRENYKKSVKIYPNTPIFSFFYTPCCWKKNFLTRETSILYFFFKDRNVLNLYLHEFTGGVFDVYFRFFLNFDVHFLENRFPNLFQKTTRVFNWKRKNSARRKLSQEDIPKSDFPNYVWKCFKKNRAPLCGAKLANHAFIWLPVQKSFFLASSIDSTFF